MKRIFIVGATGYIGSAVAEKFVARGDVVLGLTRSDEKAALLQTRGITPVRGSMEEVPPLLEYARTADATILATEAQSGDSQLAAIRSLLSALQSGQALVHTSGTGVLCDDAAGEPSDAIYAEDTPFPVLPRQQSRVVLERMVLDAPARSGVRAMVMRPPLIYGRGASRQIPNLLRVAQETGTARFVGRGLNRWSTVHLDDLADLFVLVVERGQNGQVYHAVSGEENFRSIAESIGRAFSPARPAASWTIEEADAFFDYNPTVHSSLAANSRSLSPRSQALGWTPSHLGLLADIERGSYQQT